MASLNLSINGPSIKSSYQGVVNAPAPPAGSSSTYGQWVLLSVQAPLAVAFQDGGNKESVLKVQSTGNGELDDLIEDFSEGRIQFAFVKVKDPNTGLPKYALIAWCGEGVPERTKGYFTSHLNAVSKVLHGYHVQITARTETDLEPTNILKKVADASGANYTAGGSAPVKAKGPPPAVKSKPVFAGSSGATISFNPLIAARNASLRQKTGDDGWGDDAPPVSRTEIQKVQSAYKPTRVNMDELRNQKQAPSRFTAPGAADDRSSDVIGGGYKPVGKVDIAAIRAAAKEKKDDRPAPVKGAYEPVGKVDIAALRAKSQKPSDPEPEADYQPKSLAERSAAFSRSERLTELPKPKVAKKFSGASSFMGTKAPTPGAFGFGSPSPAAAAAVPVGSASRTFADEGGKTPAQIWAEKKAQQGGMTTKAISPAATSPVTAQKSGSGWQSGYGGKSWKTVETGSYGRGIPGQKTDDTVGSQETGETPSASVGAIRDQFNEAPPPVPSVARPREIAVDSEQAPPPPPAASRPSDGGVPGGFALPGMPPRPTPASEEEEEPEPVQERSPSPIRIAVPVPRGPEPEIEPVQEPRQSLPVRPIEQELPNEKSIVPEEETHDPRAAAIAVAEEQFSHEAVAQIPAGAASGNRALIQYDYEKAEDNELELREGEYVTNIEMVDEDWWMGTNSQGETGLFPSSYVELVGDDEPADDAHAVAPPSPQPAANLTQAAPAAAPAPAAAAAEDVGNTATAQFDYEAAEDNELSFPEGAKVTHLEFPDEDWWYGHYNGEMGLFPANYVQLDQ
ncbi:hypothetical protein F4802DRAFT_564709 [Xylaria palmicola]|nr:hypothetical protein F4802DRAFT_564709 [Xylaria palmicola]